MAIDGLGRIVCVDCGSTMRLLSSRKFDENSKCYFFECTSCDHQTIFAPNPAKQRQEQQPSATQH